MISFEVIPISFFAFFQSVQNVAEHRLESDAAIRMALGVEENFHMGDTLLGHFVEIGTSEIAKIPLLDQHRHARIVEIKEIL